jgi:hypothetical protein
MPIVTIDTPLWSSPEWTLPCHGRDRGFESLQGREWDVGRIGTPPACQAVRLRVRVPYVPPGEEQGVDDGRHPPVGERSPAARTLTNFRGVIQRLG